MHLKLWKTPVLIAFALVLAAGVPVWAQGSITGTVTRSTGGSPTVSGFSFFGFLDHTDEEIRVLGADGSGYDGLNWWDDFQNYQTEAAGNPYDYYFFDTGSGAAFHLAKLIPGNSFQVENVVVSPATFPSAVSVTDLSTAGAGAVKLTWTKVTGTTYHVYRRGNGIKGSFFRRDDVTGNLSSHGVADTFYVDSGVDSLKQFEYLVIAEDAQGHYSAPSKSFVSGNYVCGDVDGSKAVNTSDVVFLISYIFAGGPIPTPLKSGDVDCSGAVNVGDAVYLINYIFASGAVPCANCK